MVFAFYLVAVMALVGFPSITSLKLDFTVNIVPFTDMISDFTNACLNVLLFVPLGIFLPVLWDKYRNVKSIILVGIYVTSVIEIMQIFTFHTTDINDIITNTAGTMIGYFAINVITNRFTQYTIQDAKNKDFYIICGTVVIIMFSMQPFISSVLWEMIL